MILMDRLNDRQGEQRFTPDSPLLSEIHNEVWTHFENLPPEETKAPGRSQVVGEFEKVISSRLELPEATKELFLESVKKPFHTRENIFRKVVGLSPLQGEEDVHKEI